MNLEQDLSDLGLGSQRWFRTAGTLLGVLRSFALCHACALPFHFRVCWKIRTYRRTEGAFRNWSNEYAPNVYAPNVNLSIATPSFSPDA